MLTLSIIVKNEERYLKECLESVKDVVDEIVLIDTGSGDGTINIAESYKAQIFHYKWNNDFAAARNFALENSSGDWILYLDADERLSQKSVVKLKKLIKEPRNEAFQCIIKNIDEIGNRPSVMKYVRLFPNDKRLRFEGKIHEQIEPALLKSNFKISDSDIEIIHIGYSLPKEELKEKAKRNLLILQEEYENNPSSYYAFQLGQTYGILENSELAVFFFKEAIKDFNLKNEYKSVAFRFIAINEAEKQNWNAALDYITKSLDYNYEQPINLLAAAKIYLQLKNYDKANKFCTDALEVNRSFQSGNKNSYQAILLDEETIIYEGLNISIQSQNKDAFNFFYDKFRKNRSRKNEKIFELIDILINKKTFSSIDEYTSEICDSNLELILTLIDGYENRIKINFLKSLYPVFQDNSVFLNKYGLVLYNERMLDEAEEMFEKSFALFKNPAAIFYLISVYLSNNKLSKIAPAIKKAESTYSGQKEIIGRLNILKEKIYPHLAPFLTLNIFLYLPIIYLR